MRFSMYTAALITIALLGSCESDGNKSSDPLVDRIANQPGREMIGTALRQMLMAANFQSVLTGQFGKISSFHKNQSPGHADSDTSYFDPVSGYWIYVHDDEWGHFHTKYRFTPHDAQGQPTSLTDSMEFIMTSSGRYGDDLIADRYQSSSNVTYSIFGLRNWTDPDKIGELVYNGSSSYSSTEKFTPDTMVTYTFQSSDRNVRMKENQCSPYTGTMTFSLVQDATPDSFSRDLNIAMGIACDTTSGCNNQGSYRITIEDLTMNGKTLFEPGGIRLILNGEEFFYEMNCDVMAVRLIN